MLINEIFMIFNVSHSCSVCPLVRVFKGCLCYDMLSGPVTGTMTPLTVTVNILPLLPRSYYSVMLKLIECYYTDLHSLCKWYLHVHYSTKCQSGVPSVSASHNNILSKQVNIHMQLDYRKRLPCILAILFHRFYNHSYNIP